VEHLITDDLGPLLRISPDCRQGIIWAAFLPLGMTTEESAYKLILTVNRIYFHVDM
jgi:hypothetical protein